MTISQKKKNNNNNFLTYMLFQTHVTFSFHATQSWMLKINVSVTLKSHSLRGVNNDQIWIFWLYYSFNVSCRLFVLVDQSDLVKRWGKPLANLLLLTWPCLLQQNLCSPAVCSLLQMPRAWTMWLTGHWVGRESKAACSVPEQENVWKPPRHLRKCCTWGRRGAPGWWAGWHLCS